MRSLLLVVAGLLVGLQGMEGDRIEAARKSRAITVDAFRSFTALHLESQFAYEIGRTAADTLKVNGVVFGQPSKTVPTLSITFETHEDKMLPPGQVIGTLRMELTTVERIRGQMRLIKQPWGVACSPFVAKSKQVALERGISEVERLMKVFGELWRESRPRRSSK
ncbi:MAG: hypothetical protein WAO58_05820 [Fimbriimonadaceae bacterium]